MWPMSLRDQICIPHTLTAKDNVLSGLQNHSRPSSSNYTRQPEHTRSKQEHHYKTRPPLTVIRTHPLIIPPQHIRCEPPRCSSTTLLICTSQTTRPTPPFETRVVIEHDYRCLFVLVVVYLWKLRKYCTSLCLFLCIYSALVLALQTQVDILHRLCQCIPMFPLHGF